MMLSVPSLFKIFIRKLTENLHLGSDSQSETQVALNLGKPGLAKPHYSELSSSFGNLRVIPLGHIRKLISLLSASILIYTLYILFWYEGDYISSSDWVRGIAGTDKNSLLSSIHYNSTIVEIIKSGSLYKLTPQDLHGKWRQPYLFDNPFAMNQTPLSNGRCPIYTYFDSESDKIKLKYQTDPIKMVLELEQRKGEVEILKTWARAMWAVGLDPIILGPSDALEHPSYREFAKSHSHLVSQHAKYFAWIARGGGIFSDYRVIPRTRNQSDEALQLLRSCQFAQPLAFDDSSLSLLVSSAKDLRPVLVDLIRGRSEKDITNHFEVYNQESFAYYSNRNFRVVTQTLQDGSNGYKLAINDEPIPPGKINRMMTTHLKQVFLDAYPGGISVSSPKHFELSSQVAKTLSQCPTSEYLNTCPPTRSVIHFLIKNAKPSRNSKNACRPLSCSSNSHSSGAHISNGFVNPLTTKAYTIATMPHPLTSLTLNYPEADLTADIVRAHSPRNEFIYGITNPILKSDSFGPDLRLLAIKDSIYQYSFDTSITWILLEDDLYERQSALIEWDLGLSLTEDLPLYSSLDYNLSSINDRIVNDLAGTDYSYDVNIKYKPDGIMDTVKSWSPADYEIWRFLHRWRLTKFKSLGIVTRQLSAIDKQLST